MAIVVLASGLAWKLALLWCLDGGGLGFLVSQAYNGGWSRSEDWETNSGVAGGLTE